MPWLNLRTIVLDGDTEAEIRAARKEFSRFDEAWEGVEWLLARDPEPQGSFVSLETDEVTYYIYGFRGDLETGIPDMWIFYEYDDDEVVIHGINANAAPADDDIEEEEE